MLLHHRPGRGLMAAHDPHQRSISAALAELSKSSANDSALEHALSTVIGAAVELVDGVDYADVMVICEGTSRSVGPTVPLLVELDAIQITLNQGPCVAAAVGGAMIRCTDLRDDLRWPDYAAAAVKAGVQSMLSLQLLTDDSGVGALNMFGRSPRIVDREAEAIGALLATLATVALMTATSQQQFKTALASRDVIGQAKGMLMNHFKVDADQAFGMLRSLSQSNNEPVRLIAQQIIETF
jgi:transcriptional regulator with GAF, ATPase, and Fis domain